MEEKSTCWQCGFEYFLHPLSNITREDYGIQAIFVVDKDSESDKGILLVCSEGDGLAYTEFMANSPDFSRDFDELL